MTKEELLANVKFNEDGLVTVVAQDYHSKHVRMVAYMNEEALRKTLETNRVYYYSRSRKELWLKGETSGYYQYLKKIAIDCDGDALLIQIEQVGGVSCHTGNKTCFYREMDGMSGSKIEERNNQGEMLKDLENTVIERKNHPKEGSYTNYLLNKGVDKILKKVGEEATEIVIAAKNPDPKETVFEVADFLYHVTVLLVHLGISWEDIATELKNRE